MYENKHSYRKEGSSDPLNFLIFFLFIYLLFSDCNFQIFFLFFITCRCMRTSTLIARRRFMRSIKFSNIFSFYLFIFYFWFSISLIFYNIQRVRVSWDPLNFLPFFSFYLFFLIVTFKFFSSFLNMQVYDNKHSYRKEHVLEGHGTH